MRLVVGRWEESPFGAFTDVMVERADGHRILLAPSPQIEGYVTRTYSFDETRIEPVTLRRPGGRWEVSAPSLRLSFTVGGRHPVGWLLRSVPAPVAAHPLWCRAIGPIAALIVPGVRTVGTALEGRREYYGATDLCRVTSVSGELDGEPLGTLAAIDPPCRFGFSSTPPWPSVTTVTTTIDHL